MMFYLLLLMMMMMSYLLYRRHHPLGIILSHYVHLAPRFLFSNRFMGASAVVYIPPGAAVPTAAGANISSEIDRCRGCDMANVYLPSDASARTSPPGHIILETRIYVGTYCKTADGEQFASAAVGAISSVFMLHTAIQLLLFRLS